MKVRVSKLVFYAQSTGAVISGRCEGEGRGRLYIPMATLPPPQ